MSTAATARATVAPSGDPARERALEAAKMRQTLQEEAHAGEVRRLQRERELLAERERIQAEQGELARRNEELQRSAREKAEMASLASQMQALGHQTRMGIIRNIR
jgi:hypothetical protein